MRREKLDHFVTIGVIEGKQKENMLDGQKNWLKVGQVTEALAAAKERDACKVMITQAKEHGT